MHTPHKIDAKIASLFENQKNSFLNHGVPGYKKRYSQLKKLYRAVLDSEADILTALRSDLGKNDTESLISDVFTITDEIRHTISHLKKWMRPQRVRPTLTMLAMKGKIIREPMGVVLIISPWNYPFNLAIIPLIQALAAGNRVIIKPSEMTPATSTLIKRFIERIFPAEEVAVVEGGAETATELLKLPFNHIYFTGSPRVGKIVMEAASRHLTSVTLELGGKSPMIVDETADLALAAHKAAWGKGFNAGQTCVAPDYLLVHESVKDRFLHLFREELNRQWSNRDDQTALVSDGHYQRISAILENAVKSGAVILHGGQKDAATRYIEPTILTDVNPDMTIMQEEIFGPLAPVIPYSTYDEALTFIRNLPKPLALYIFSRKRAKIENWLKETSAGGTCINDIMAHYAHPNLPFGGVNNSGIGKSHGEFGFRAFSNERAVLAPRWGLNLWKFVTPPYSDNKSRLVRFLIYRR